MATPKTYQILIWISLALGIIITCDIFLFPTHEKMEVLDNGTTETTRTKVSSSYESYFFLTKDGRCYKIDTGTINSTYYGYIILGLLIIYPLLVLTGILKVNTSGKQTYVYVCFTVALGTLAFYLYY